MTQEGGAEAAGLASSLCQAALRGLEVGVQPRNKEVKPQWEL